MSVVSSRLRSGDVVDDPNSGTFLLLSNKVVKGRRRLRWLALSDRVGSLVTQTVMPDTVFRNAELLMKSSLLARPEVG